MKAGTYITLKEATELTGKNPRTIRYHLQKFREVTNDKKILDSVFRYKEIDKDNYLLLINIDFIKKLYPAVVNEGLKKTNEIKENVSTEPMKYDQTRPSPSEIEDLVQMRMKVMQDAHQKEIERLEKAHQDYLERLDAGAIRMIDQHNKVVDLLSKTNDSLQKQLVAKDETARYLIEQIRELKQEKQITESSYIDIKNDVEAELDNVASQHDPSNAETIQDAEPIDEAEQDTRPKNIDEALSQGMSFADWMAGQNN